ncbi:hypothetical protein CIRMBP1210_02060 [Enterococcus cecorum]|nr:hypothetical protein CIRMBP1257_01879 [Enterococcus cecorum]CAI3493012.1 hypothetical protein CIRMBP1210_02060 [Enterococcus cecorum]
MTIMHIFAYILLALGMYEAYFVSKAICLEKNGQKQEVAIALPLGIPQGLMFVVLMFLLGISFLLPSCW